VAVCGRDPGTIESVASETLAAGAGDAAGIAADLTTPEGVARRRRGQGGARAGRRPVRVRRWLRGPPPLVETELDEWNAVVESNLTSTFLNLTSTFLTLRGVRRGHAGARLGVDRHHGFKPPRVSSTSS
jgi:hypothetical protein